MRITSPARVPSSHHFEARHTAILLRGGIFALLFAFFLAYSPRVSAQITNVTNDQATPIPGAGHDYIHMLAETVDPGNGSVSLRIQTPTPSGRLLTIPFGFDYGTNGIHHLTTNPNGAPVWADDGTPYQRGGWSYSIPLVTYIYGIDIIVGGADQGESSSCSYYSGFVFQDPSGTRHALGISAAQPYSPGACLYPANAVPNAGDDYYRASTSPNFSDPNAVVVSADGTVYSFSCSQCSPGGYGLAVVHIEDRNGNIATSTTNAQGAYTLTDTLGRPLISTSSFASSAGDSISISGIVKPYIVNWKTENSNFSIPITEIYGSTCPVPANTDQRTVVSSITLPNGQAYTFLYGTDDPSNSNPYGLLSKIVYPSGGWVKYTYGMNSASDEFSSVVEGNNRGVPTESSCTFLYGTPAVTQRTVSFDGTHVALQQTFSYSTSWYSTLWTSKSTIVTSTDMVSGQTSVTDYTYSYVIVQNPPDMNGGGGSQVPVESSITYKDGSQHVLETVTKTWQDQYLLQSEQITPGGLSTSSKSVYAYGPGGQVTEKDEYDYGQSTPTRVTKTAYQSFAATPIYPQGPSIFDRPSSVITYDGGGNRVAETDYSYDQNPVASASAVQHDGTYYGQTSSAPRGNLTTVTKQCFPNCVQDPNAYTAATTTYSYDETGHVVSATAPCGNSTCNKMYYGTNTSTAYTYSDSYTSCSGSAPPSGNTNAYLTKVTNEKGFTTSYCYGYMEGQLRGSTDENSQVTAYQYNDPLNRLTNVAYPIGATNISYNDAPPNPSITTEKEIQPGQYVTTVGVMDGVGHVIDSQLTSAPACQIVHTTTSYVGIGKPYQVSNPYCSTSDPTYGLTTYVYDALGRTTSITHSADGSSIQTVYTGRATQVSDEGNGTHHIVHISQTDGLGRLSSVCEVTSTVVLGSGSSPSACGQDISATGFLTTYAYNALDDLTQVSEGSLNPRTFTYNSLSELVCSANPEIQPAACPTSDGGTWVSGTTRYTYDLNGNLLTKTSPAPNQTNPAVSILVIYGYDVLNRQMDLWPPNGEPDTFYGYDQSGFGYSIGRLTGVGRYDNSDSNWYSYTAPSYDAMGRVTLLNECAVQDCPATHWDVTTGYDYLGDVTSWTNAFGGTFTATYNNAQQLTGVTNNLSNGNYPSPMLSNVLYNGPGQLFSAQIGTGAGVVTETRAYDKRLRPITLTDGAAYSFNITNYAPDGDILAVTDSVNGAWGYGTGSNYTNGYDDMNRLLMAVPAGKTWSYTYAYDRYGNRWQQNLGGTGGSGPHFSATFDANNHVSDGTVSYDAVGNVMQDAFNTYTYDSQNQMISSLSRSSGSLTCYFYDAFGRRVQKATGATSCGYPFVGGTSLYYVYDVVGNVIDEVSAPGGGTGNWTRQEIYSAGRHLATFNASAGQAYWDFSDWLGTERARVNAVTGAVAETCTSLPWGDNLQCTGTDQSPLHFTGKQRDSESGLDNFGARYNSSQMGRFMSPDPSGIDLADWRDPQQLNLYSYVRNNPLTLTDPYGLDCAYLNDAGNGVESIDRNSNAGECSDNGGYWVDQTANANSFHDYGNGFASMQNTNGTSYLFCTGGDCSQPPPFSMGGPPPNDAISNDPLFDGALFIALAGGPGLVRGGASLLGDLFGAGARTATQTAASTLTQSAAGDIIGWGTGQAGAEATRELAQTLTPDAVKQMIANGLTKEMVQQLANKYGAAIAAGGAKLANTQLQPRYELMQKILEMWPNK